MVIKAFCYLLLTQSHTEWPKLYGVLAILSATGLKHMEYNLQTQNFNGKTFHSTLIQLQYKGTPPK